MLNAHFTQDLPFFLLLLLRRTTCACVKCSFRCQRLSALKEQQPWLRRRRRQYDCINWQTKRIASGKGLQIKGNGLAWYGVRHDKNHNSTIIWSAIWIVVWTYDKIHRSCNDNVCSHSMFIKKKTVKQFTVDTVTWFGGNDMRWVSSVQKE